MASARVAKVKRQGSSRKDLSPASIQDGDDDKQSGYKLEDLEILSTIGESRVTTEKRGVCKQLMIAVETGGDSVRVCVCVCQ